MASVAAGNAKESGAISPEALALLASQLESLGLTETAEILKKEQSGKYPPLSSKSTLQPV
tara:strand:- start:187 stop:366 length:180 start_codon:yes stop_codon:yes gene_type:complete